MANIGRVNIGAQRDGRPPAAGAARLARSEDPGAALRRGVLRLHRRIDHQRGTAPHPDRRRCAYRAGGHEHQRGPERGPWGRVRSRPAARSGWSRAHHQGDLAMNASPKNEPERILVVGRSPSVLVDAVEILRTKGYSADATNQFDRVLDDYDVT